MSFTTENLQYLFADFARIMAAERDYLCTLDGAIGDADHGIAMQQGMAAASVAASNVIDGKFNEIFNAAAKGFLNSVGASTGPLYATAFMWAGKRVGPVQSMPHDDLRHVITAMADGIQHRGKAVTGQKTMFDAWSPAAEAASMGANAAAITSAAETGAVATRNMVATLGRAARLGERSIGHPDPGAISAVMIIRQICVNF